MRNTMFGPSTNSTSQLDSAEITGGDSSTKFVGRIAAGELSAKRDFQLLKVEYPIPRAEQNAWIDKPLSACSQNNACHPAIVRRLLRGFIFSFICLIPTSVGKPGNLNHWNARGYNGLV